MLTLSRSCPAGTPPGDWIEADLAMPVAAAARLAEMTPPGMRADIHLTLTDEYPLAQAFVMIVAVPASAP